MNPVVLDERWGGVDGLFGGHIFTAVTDAAVEVAAQPLVMLTLCFRAAAHAGPAQTAVTTEHAGRRTSSHRVELWQEDRLRVHAVTEHAHPAESMLHRRVEELPPRPATAAANPEGHGTLRFRERFEMLLVRQPTVGGPNAAWVRFREDPMTLGIRTREGVFSTLLDVMPPGLFSHRPKTWFVPTLSFTGHYAPVPREFDPAGWFFLTHSTLWATETLCVDEATVWDAEGRLLAQGRQSRSVLWPS